MYRETEKRFHFFLLGGQSGGMGANCGLHPLIHTFLDFNLAQDIVIFQRFLDFGNSLPQTGHVLSDGFTINYGEVARRIACLSGIIIKEVNF